MKETLFGQGDRLETLIIKAEREIRALENTLKILTLNNAQMKKNFDFSSSNDDELEQLRQLETHRRALNEQIRLREETLTRLRREIDGNASLSELEDQLVESSVQLADKARRQLELEEEIEQLKAKIRRAELSIRRLPRPNARLDEDVRLELAKATNEKIERLIIAFCSNCPDRSVMKTLEEVSEKLKEI